MNADSTIADPSGPTGAVGSLAELARISFSSLDPTEIIVTATDGVGALSPCRVEASYCAVGDEMMMWPPSQSPHPELTDGLQDSGWQGSIVPAHGGWGRALPLRHREAVHGCLVVSATVEPTEDHLLMLGLLAQQAGAALACAQLHRRDVRRARQLEVSNQNLAHAVQRLEARSRVHELLESALAEGTGQEGIVEALHRVTGRSVCLEDKFGNLLAWAGPGRPLRYPKPKRSQRDRFLHVLSTQGAPVQSGKRLCVLIQPHAEVLGVVALLEAHDEIDDDQLFALRYGSSVLGLELSHRRTLAEMQLNLRRELVDDLLAGTDAEGAYARAEALGHDLRRPQYVVAIHITRDASNSDVAAVNRAAANIHLNYLLGHQGRLIVLLVDGHPSLDALHQEVSRQLGHVSSAIGMGPRCDVPTEIPLSFLRARRALNIRLNSAHPEGAADYDELGFYHLVDAAHTVGVAHEYVRQWLGALIDYDTAKKSDLVRTLNFYLECGGNYDESATALHVHRSTLRYRLGRIADLTGFDLRDVDTRFNLHAATRAWRFLTPDP
jgi:sugar diacid utilization regulator